MIFSFSLVDLFRDPKISKIKKTNMAFLIVLLPIAGSILYFVMKFSSPTEPYNAKIKTLKSKMSRIGVFTAAVV